MPLLWERIKSFQEGPDGRRHARRAFRAQIPGGWLLVMGEVGENTPVFIPDESHSWEVELDREEASAPA